MLAANHSYYTVENLSAEAALQELLDGNQRYALDHVEHPHEGSQRRVDLSVAQHPFAIILGCADSRVVPELIFDQGVGDLFVLRVAGNVADEAVLASIEFAVEHLGTRLVVVLGHERCGAVMAAINHAFSEGKLNSLISYIEPAIKAGREANGDCVVSDTVKAHVHLMVKQIQSTEPILSHEVKNSSLKVVPAYYRLATGKVEFL
ncbi:carbonic anhydrase [Pseudanabaena sp. FACHB-1998]|uniref:carbonic anhydrase n=1 Tax=Pseudanabaena sp. FACHB-1998 TaxID=2692858 RepID=UPI0016803703|nr:carbonic anhydrase [Pseudanabaena sp. FACHB-1998]MBD2175763.1 carbonic anhydrase [Pseudanabaena sp. FACHB-1998]